MSTSSLSPGRKLALCGQLSASIYYLFLYTLTSMPASLSILNVSVIAMHFPFTGFRASGAPVVLPLHCKGLDAVGRFLDR